MASADLNRVQDLARVWWEKAEPAVLEAGRLAWTFVPYPEVVSRGLVLEGREDPRDHSTARFRVEPLRVGTPPKISKLPVAALPTFTGESYVAQRGKKRPVLVLSMGGPEIPKAVSQGAPGYQRKPCVLVMPYYGVDQDGKRAGFAPEFITRIRRTEYPQYMLDTLPVGGSSESVLRLDHVLAVGSAASNFELSPYRLHAEAFDLVLDWFRWLVEGDVPADGLLAMARSDLMRVEAIT